MRTALNQAIAAALLCVALVCPPGRGPTTRASSGPCSGVSRSSFTRAVAAEPLDAFLAAEQAGIAETLEAVESWSVATIEHYPPTPEDLRWGTDHAPTAERFFRGDQGQPDAAVSPLRGSLPERAQPEQAPLAWSELSFLGGGTSQLAARYWASRPASPYRSRR